MQDTQQDARQESTQGAGIYRPQGRGTRRGTAGAPQPSTPLPSLFDVEAPIAPPGAEAPAVVPQTRHHPGTRVRKGDPETSRAVARGVAGDRGRLTWRQAVVMAALREAGAAGLTDEELTERTQATIGPGSTARTRRAELVEAGAVRWSGETRAMTTGNRARVWVLAGQPGGQE